MTFEPPVPEDHVSTLDFSHVTSRAIAERLFEAGELERILLFPLEFGGEDIPPNVLYVPLGLADVKTQVDSMVARLVEDGNATNYAAEPEYKGASHIPCRLRIRAWVPGRQGSFESVIEMW